MNTQIEVLLIAQPSRFRDSIHLLLTSMSPIEQIHLADEIESALIMKEAPAILVIDADLGFGRLSTTVKKIKAAWPQVRLIILVEDDLEIQATRAAGADVLLRKGFPAAKLIEVVKTLLSN